MDKVWVLRQLQEARETVDRIYRQEALDFFDLLKKYLERNKHNIGQKKKAQQFDGFVLTPRDLKTARTYPDLFVVLAEKSHLAGLGSAGPNQIAIVLPILKSPYNPTNVETRITGAKSAFVHEFIHYLDEKRTGGRAIGAGAQRSTLDVKDVKDYYSNPAEFNAFYQEGANEILQFLRTVQTRVEPRRPGKLASYLTDFRTFEKHFKKEPYFNEDFLKYINKKYERKLVKRLYDLYQTIKAEMDM